MKLKTLNQLTVLETLLFSYPQMIFGLYQEARDIYVIGFSFIINLGWKVAGGEGSFFVPVPKIYQFHINLWQGRNLLSVSTNETPHLWSVSANQRPVFRSRDLSGPMGGRVSDWLMRSRVRAASANFCVILWEPRPPERLLLRDRVACGERSRDADANNTFVNLL